MSQADPAPVTGARPFYDLTNPIVYHRDEATIEGADEQKVVIQRARRPSTGLQDFERYTAALLNSVLDTSPSYGAVSAGLAMEDQRESAIIMEAPPALRPEMRARTLTGSAIAAGCEREGVQGSGLGESEAQLEGEGCKAAVEIVSRNSQKGTSRGEVCRTDAGASLVRHQQGRLPRRVAHACQVCVPTGRNGEWLCRDQLGRRSCPPRMYTSFTARRADL